MWPNPNNNTESTVCLICSPRVKNARVFPVFDRNKTTFDVKTLSRIVFPLSKAAELSRGCKALKGGKGLLLAETMAVRLRSGIAS